MIHMEHPAWEMALSLTPAKEDIKFTFGDKIGAEIFVKRCCEHPSPNFWLPTKTLYCANCDDTYVTLSWEEQE